MDARIVNVLLLVGGMTAAMIGAWLLVAKDEVPPPVVPTCDCTASCQQAVTKSLEPLNARINTVKVEGEKNDAALLARMNALAEAKADKVAQGGQDGGDGAKPWKPVACTTATGISRAVLDKDGNCVACGCKNCPQCPGGCNWDCVKDKDVDGYACNYANCGTDGAKCCATGGKKCKDGFTCSEHKKCVKDSVGN